jgi:hypothetical protein
MLSLREDLKALFGLQRKVEGKKVNGKILNGKKVKRK